MAGGLAEALAQVAEVGPLVARHAEESERIGRLAPDVVDAFHESRLWRVLLPRGLGGYELTIPESIEVFRAMAAHDASAGWLHAICGQGPQFGNYVTQDVF